MMYESYDIVSPLTDYHGVSAKVQHEHVTNDG